MREETPVLKSFSMISVLVGAIAYSFTRKGNYSSKIESLNLELSLGPQGAGNSKAKKESNSK